MLTMSSVASCSCDTKSPDPNFHAVTCLYRTLQEAYTLISELVGRNPGWQMPNLFDPPDTLPKPLGPPFAPVSPIEMPPYEFQQGEGPSQVSSTPDTHSLPPGITVTVVPPPQSYYVDPTAAEIQYRRLTTGQGLKACERELVRDRAIVAIKSLDGGPRDLPTIKDILTVLIRAQ